MKKLGLPFTLFIIVNIMILLAIDKSITGFYSENVKELVINSDKGVGYYGSTMIYDNIHFLYASENNDKTILGHYCIDNG